MKRYILFIAAAILFLGKALFAYSNEQLPDPQTLISEMSRATHRLNYEGILMYHQGNQIETMRVIHGSKRNGIYEKLLSLTGHPREIIRDKSEVKCIFPENELVVVYESRAGTLISRDLPESIQSISDYYSFDITGEDRVAGMKTWVVNIKPNDKYRYGYRLWIEKESKLLLKSELKNHLDKTLEQFMFVQLNILDNIKHKLLQPTTQASDFTWYNTINRGEETISKNKGRWQVTWMPAGFTINKHLRKPMQANQEPVEHLIYTDGLAIVSVFIEKINQRSAMVTETTQLGGVNSYATETDGYQITVVGEVPELTVKLVANSVKTSH